MGKAKKEEQKKIITEKVPALVLAKNNEVRGTVLPAGTVIMVGECREDLTITDVNKAIARGNVKAIETEVPFEDTNKAGDPAPGDEDNGGDRGSE